MKKTLALLLSLLFFQQIIFADAVFYAEKNKFGLKDSSGNIITKPKYKKLVRLGESSWIMQERMKFGIIDNDGNVVVKPVYNQAERVLGKYVKFRKGSKYCLLNERGENIIKTDNDDMYYSSIDLLHGGLIVTSRNHKYGLTSFNGNTQLNNIFDDIYMPNKDSIIVVYGGQQMEFKRKESSDTPFDFVFTDLESQDLTPADIANSPLATTGYYSITFTDYILKIVSSISPAYEETIDELMFSQGADTVSVLMRCSWLPKFPFVYAKNYYYYMTDPTTGPLNKAKKSLRKQIKE